MSAKNNRQRLSTEVRYAILEVIIAIAVAIAVKLLLGDDDLATAASTIIGCIGLLLGFHRLITIFETTKSIDRLSNSLISHSTTVTSSIKKTETRVSNDISRLSSRIGLSEIGETFNLIDDEFLQDKVNIIRSTHEQLRHLKDSMQSSPLAKAAFYQWIHENLGRLQSGDSLIAVSLMNNAEWEDSPAERRFFRQNITIAEHGVTVERIFICDKKIWDMASTQATLENELAINAGRVVRRHFANKEPKNLRGYHADESHLHISDPKLLERIGDGFLMLRFAGTGDRVALLDDYRNPTLAAGKVTKLPQKLDELEYAFSELRTFSNHL